MHKAVIFDLDGTLADTLEDLARAVNGALGRRGFPLHPLDAYRRMVGDGFRLLVTRALPEDQRLPDRIEELRAEASADYEEHCLVSTRPYEGVPELLAALHARGIPLAILSNKPHELCLRVVAGLFPGAGFALVRGEAPGFPRKPDPASALDIARRLDLPPSEFAYLGDSDVDMSTAKAAGMTALGAGWGFRGAPELAAAGAAAILGSPMELLDFL
ncbi:MAG TPA: HAD family hydrolase [Rectinemataceae bacterium]|nr:HAD family hydrolase [Rectinemataceae bacterium]